MEGRDIERAISPLIEAFGGENAVTIVWICEKLPISPEKIAEKLPNSISEDNLTELLDELLALGIVRQQPAKRSTESHRIFLYQSNPWAVQVVNIMLSNAGSCRQGVVT